MICVTLVNLGGDVVCTHWAPTYTTPDLLTLLLPLCIRAPDGSPGTALGVRYIVEAEDELFEPTRAVGDIAADGQCVLRIVYGESP